MISIECHRSGERCPGKREFDNRIEINRVRSGEIDVAIPFNTCIDYFWDFVQDLFMAYEQDLARSMMAWNLAQLTV